MSKDRGGYPSDYDEDQWSPEDAQGIGRKAQNAADKIKGKMGQAADNVQQKFNDATNNRDAGSAARDAKDSVKNKMQQGADKLSQSKDKFGQHADDLRDNLRDDDY